MSRRIRLFALLILLVYWDGFFSLTCAQSQPNKTNGLALVGAKIYPSPAAPAIVDGVVLIKNGRIVAVGEKQRIKISSAVRIIDCTGLTLVAGFWNSHVHFSESKGSDHLPLASIIG